MTLTVRLKVYLGFYLDGREVAAQSSIYPKPSPPPTSYHFGHDPFDEDYEDDEEQSRWSMSSCHVIATSLSPDFIMLAHRLGPRYQGNFQDASLFRFLTYQMYTSINVHLFHGQQAAKPGDPGRNASLAKGLTGDVGFDEGQVILALSPAGTMEDPEQPEMSGIYVVQNTGQWNSKSDTYARVIGDVWTSRSRPFDVALWRAGGPFIVLELIHYSTVCMADFVRLYVGLTQQTSFLDLRRSAQLSHTLL